MRDRDFGWSLEQWEMGKKDIEGRVILAPTPREGECGMTSWSFEADNCVIVGVGVGPVGEGPVRASSAD